MPHQDANALGRSAKLLNLPILVQEELEVLADEMVGCGEQLFDTIFNKRRMTCESLAWIDMCFTWHY